MGRMFNFAPLTIFSRPARFSGSILMLAWLGLRWQMFNFKLFMKEKKRIPKLIGSNLCHKFSFVFLGFWESSPREIFHFVAN